MKSLAFIKAIVNPRQGIFALVKGFDSIIDHIGHETHAQYRKDINIRMMEAPFSRLALSFAWRSRFSA